MAFTLPPTQPDFNRLKSVLLTSELQIKNNPLYQVINQLIDAIAKFQSIVNDNIDELQPSGAVSNSGVSGVTSLVGTDIEEQEYPYIIPGDRGIQGMMGLQGIPGIDGLDGEEEFIYLLSMQSLPGPLQTYTETNVTTDRSFDANSTTLDEIADVLGTLIGDLRARGIVS